MEWQVLIAEPRETQRTLLRTIYSASRLVTHVEVVTSCTELHDQLENRSTDFFVVHQSLITDLALLPEGHFVIIASELDNDMLIAAYSHGALGYYPDNPLPLAQLLAVLDPTGDSWLPEYLAQARSSSLNELLTPRQQQVFAMRQEGLSYKNIAEQLQISQHTVKNHLEVARERLREQNWHTR